MDNGDTGNTGGNPTLLILAAGMASRYGSLKQLERFGPGGETIMDYSVYDAIRAGFGKVVFVIRRSIDREFREFLLRNFSDRIEVATVNQELDMLPEGFTLPDERTKPWGTGHAVLTAAHEIDRPFAVINADDYYGARSFQSMAAFLKTNSSKDQYALMGYRLDHTLSKHGAVSRGICAVDENDFLESVEEYTRIIGTEDGIIAHTADGDISLKGDEVVSMNMMGFDPSVLNYFRVYFEKFLETEGANTKAEFYLPMAVNYLIKSRLARVRVLRSPDKWFGVTYQEDKASARERLVELVDAGVYPGKLWR